MSSHISLSRGTSFLLVLAAAGFLFQGLPLMASDVVPPVFSSGAEQRAVPEPPPMRLAAMAAVAPAAGLRSAEEGAGDQLDALAAWNGSGRTPTRDGFVRPLSLARNVQLEDELGRGGVSFRHGGVAARLPSGELVFGLRVDVGGAYRLRLHLEMVNLPSAARLWVYGDDPDDATSFGLELRGPDGDIWTPSIAGDQLNLEVLVPPEHLARGVPMGFVATEVAESFLLDEQGQPMVPGQEDVVPRDTSCFVDGMCITASEFAKIDQLREAIGNIKFISGSFSYRCSGGLLADQPGSMTPYFLTAHHCIGNQTEATTVEAWFSDYTDYCNGPPKAFNDLPKVNGATYLKSGAAPSQSDYSLLKLLATPSGPRIFLGSDVNLPVDGTVLYRLSHPVMTGISLPQRWAKHRVDQAGTPFCEGAPRLRFLYSWDLEGGSGGGSSGSPLVDSELNVRGQLLGACGPEVTNECNRENATVDGFFGATYPHIKQWLDPSIQPGDCVEDGVTHCLNEDRFQVRVTWRDFSGNTGSGQAVPLTADSGLFYFFTFDNIEFLVKVLDGCSINNSYWVFAAATTNVEYTLEVVDTQGNESKTYTNALGTAAPAITDTGAFDTCP